MSRFPFARYPNGWFQVAYSSELASGQIVPLSYFGKELILFRGENSEASVLDAFCPHLGAHIGHGGKVVGDSVRCPFHAWEFNGKGECTKVPYAQKTPGKARLSPWHTIERNGLIMVWYHGDGVAPTWEVPVLPEFGHEDWTPYETLRWKIKTHNQEMAENAVDSAHFHYVHGTQEIGTSHAEQDGHILHVVSSTAMKTPMGRVNGQVEVHAYGFGFTMNRFTGLVETLLVSSVTGIDDDYVDVRFSFMVKKKEFAHVTSTIGAAFIREISRQLAQDIPIWENKVYLPTPMLCDGDGPIGVFRKWCKQFYSESQRPASLPMVASA